MLSDRCVERREVVGDIVERNLTAEKLNLYGHITHVCNKFVSPSCLGHHCEPNVGVSNITNLDQQKSLLETTIMH